MLRAYRQGPVPLRKRKLPHLFPSPSLSPAPAAARESSDYVSMDERERTSR